MMAPNRKRRAVIDDSEDESSSGWDSDKLEEDDEVSKAESNLSEYEL